MERFHSNILGPFNPLPSHEGRLLCFCHVHSSNRLSIHFPLTREDECRRLQTEPFEAFNPLPSHEGRLLPLLHLQHHTLFQSTSLSRGKTLHVFQISDTRNFQSTSLSRGKTISEERMRRKEELSIHFPLTREDPSDHPSRSETASFNPLPSHEGRLSEK